jgi:hypothetical protein
MNERFEMSRAPELIGRRVIIDLEIRTGDDKPIERRQLYGEIERISEGEGVVVRLHPSGREYRLPPALDEFEPLEPGLRRLEPGGEAIDGAEFLVRTVVHEPPPEMDVPPVRDLPNENPMLEQDGQGGYRSVEE